MKPMQRPQSIMYIATTLDGFIARLDNQIDWLDHDSGGEDYGWAQFRSSIDALIIGRKTYQQVLGFGGEWPYVGLRTVVWSRTLRPSDIPAGLSEQRVEVSNMSPQLILESLGEGGVKKVWIDGGMTLKAFVAAGLLDRLIITRIPILIGEGIPLL
jgi:dihydrofolate reductase